MYINDNKEGPWLYLNKEGEYKRIVSFKNDMIDGPVWIYNQSKQKEPQKLLFSAGIPLIIQN